MQYHFEWDPAKAASNLRKHAVSFEEAAMKDEYDFSKGVRGRFYRPDAQLNIPVYLEPDIEAWISEKAKGVAAQQLVNDLLRIDISMVREVSG